MGFLCTVSLCHIYCFSDLLDRALEWVNLQTSFSRRSQDFSKPPMEISFNEVSNLFGIQSLYIYRGPHHLPLWLLPVTAAILFDIQYCLIKVRLFDRCHSTEAEEHNPRLLNGASSSQKLQEEKLQDQNYLDEIFFFFFWLSSMQASDVITWPWEDAYKAEKLYRSWFQTELPVSPSLLIKIVLPHLAGWLMYCIANKAWI